MKKFVLILLFSFICFSCTDLGDVQDRMAPIDKYIKENNFNYNNVRILDIPVPKNNLLATGISIMMDKTMQNPSSLELTKILNNGIKDIIFIVTSSNPSIAKATLDNAISNSNPTKSSTIYLLDNVDKSLQQKAKQKQIDLKFIPFK